VRAVLAGLLAVGLTACAAQATVPAGVPGRDRPVRVLLYGDSLADQAAGFFVKAVTASRRALVVLRTAPGSAPCDWLADMSRTVSRFRPDAAVVEFSGNNLTPCMRDKATRKGLTGDALVARYTADAEKVTETLSRDGATVYWMGAPPDRLPALSVTAARINGVYALLPGRDQSARFSDAGAAVLDHGAYADYLPCLPSEPCTGPYRNGVRTNQVRAPDGVHFCPAPPAGRAPCPVWSSGAFRFGTAMAQPIISAYSL
jgi:hypothetical protein